MRLKAYAPSPFTYSSVPSILSGLYPHTHGALIGDLVKNLDRPSSLKPLRGSVITLPELLSALGYDIHFVTNVYLAFHPLRGRVIPSMPTYFAWERSGVLLRKALASIRGSVKGGKKFFAYIHLCGVHKPLNPPENFKHYFGRLENLPNIKS